MSNVTQKSIDISQNRLKLDTFFDICNQKRKNDPKIRENPGKSKNLGKWAQKSGLRCAKSIPQISARPRMAL